MFKSIFESADQCGAPNPLLTLAKNFGGHTNGAQQNVGGLLGTSNSSALATGDLLVQEYLANVAQHTIPPSTFDMRQLMAQMPAMAVGNNQKIVGKSSPMLEMEKSWAEVGERSLASEWSGQFLESHQKQPNDLALKWMNEYSSETDNEMEKEWQIARESMWAKDFLENYETKMAQQNGNDGGMAEQWENEFMKMINENRNGENVPQFFDYETAWENAAKEAQEKYKFLETCWAVLLAIAQKGSDQSRKANPYLREQNGVEMAKLSLGKGHLADSILHFEAALQQEPNNPQIWYSLGLALAENEQDPRAIAALRNCLKLEPQNQKAILALAVSLANESFEHLALQELHKWICIHQGQQMPNEPSNYSQYAEMDRAQFGKVESQFLDAASRAAQIDSELQNALSVLYNLGNDFDRAVDCLRAALSIQPNDPTLWNRLGATLANADRSAEAISAYKRALQMSPSYVRARYNLGTACMNLNSFRDAAAHFIAALQIQHSPDQSQIWSRLRSALIRIEHAEFGNELFEALEGRNLARIVQILQAQGILLSTAGQEE